MDRHLFMVKQLSIPWINLGGTLTLKIMLIMMVVMAMMTMREFNETEIWHGGGLGKEAPISKQQLFGVGSSDSSHFVEFCHYMIYQYCILFLKRNSSFFFGGGGMAPVAHLICH